MVGSSGSYLFEVESVGSESVVQGLEYKNVSNVGSDFSDNGEEDGGEVRRKERGVVVLLGIDPSEKEVVVSVWVSFSGEEEFLGGSFVELSSAFGAKGHVDNMEIAVFGILEPFSVWSSLDVVVGPVPGVLAFNNV